jgi:hypothetical protein
MGKGGEKFMRKILSGMLGIVMTASVVGGVAYAAFTTTGTVSGINITAGNAAIEIGPDLAGATSNSFITGLTITGVYPGFGISNDQFTTFVVENTGSVSLAISAQLTAATGWGTTGANLKNYVEVAVNTADDSGTTGWHTLADWNAGSFNFPGAAIASLGNTTYKVYVRVPADAPNAIQSEHLEDITFTLTGTQQ